MTQGGDQVCDLGGGGKKETKIVGGERVGEK